MNPIPLSSPDGTVYTYACGVCHQLATVQELSDCPPDDELANDRREQAERCCRCVNCGNVCERDVSALKRCRACVPAVEAAAAAASKAFADAYEQRERRNDEAMAACPNPEAAKLLLDQMRDFSAWCWCAAWHVGLGDSLWDLATNPGHHEYGRGVVTKHGCVELMRLATLCDGWWTWSEHHCGEVFVRLGEWQKRREAGSNEP